MACIICFDIIAYILFSRLSDCFLSLHYTLRFEPVGGSMVASQKIIRLGVIRINAGLMLGSMYPMDCPPSGRAWACPRISMLRVFHGGSTSSTKKDASPLGAILRNFKVLPMAYPPILWVSS